MTTTHTSQYLDHEATVFRLAEVDRLRDREVAVFFSDESWERAAFKVFPPEEAIGDRVAVAVDFRIPLQPDIWSPADAGFPQASFAKVPPLANQVFLTREGLSALISPRGKRRLYSLHLE